MNQHLWKLVAAGSAWLLAAGCVKDPTESIRTNTVARVAASNRYVVLNVADSARLSAQAVDEQGNVLADPVTVTALDQTIVSAAAAAASTPLTQTNFYAKALAFGTGRIEVAVGSARDTVRVKTLPASVRIGGVTDTLLPSGGTLQLAAQPLDAKNVVITGVTPVTWTSSNDTNAAISTAGLVSGKRPGFVEIGLNVPGASTKVAFVVVPGTFGGSLSAASGNPGDIVTVTRAAGGPVFDADTRAVFGSLRTFIFGLTADNMQIVIPGFGSTGAKTLQFQNMGPEQVAQNTTFTSNTASLVDNTEPNDDPLTAPAAVNGDTYILLHGGCTDGVADDATADCDDFFTITNATAAAISVTARIDWFTNADVDILWCNAACTAFVGNFAGATTANPESSTVTIQAGVTYRLWLNLFGPGAGVASDLVRVRISGLP